MRQGNLNDFSAQLFVFFNGLHDFSLNLSINAFTEVFLRQTDAQAFNVIYQCFGEVGNLYVKRGGVHLVLTADSVEYQSSVGYVFSDRSDLVQRGCECYAAITGYTAVGRFNTNAAVEGCRLTDRAAGIGAQSPDSFACSDSSSAAAGGAAGNAVQVPWVVGYTEMRGFGGRAHSKFIQVGFAQENGFISAQVFDNMCVIYGNEVLQHFGGTGSAQAFSRDIIFDCARNTCQRSDFLACGNLSINLGSLCQSVFFIQGYIRVNLVFNCVDTRNNSVS